MARPLQLASAQFPVSGDISANLAHIRKQVRAAVTNRAQVVLFPETALSGYAPKHLDTLDGYDWVALERATNQVQALAAGHGLWILLGSMRRMVGGRPRICLHAIGPDGAMVAVYDKRKLSGSERDMFDPGREAVVIDIEGHRCGLLLCYENCFPKLYEDYRRDDVGLIFHAFFNAERDASGSLDELMPASLAVRAADHGLHICASNSCAGWSPMSSRVVRPDGSSVSAPQHVPGVVMDVYPCPELGWTYDIRVPSKGGDHRRAS